MLWLRRPHMRRQRAADQKGCRIGFRTHLGDVDLLGTSATDLDVARQLRDGTHDPLKAVVSGVDPSKPSVDIITRVARSASWPLLQWGEVPYAERGTRGLPGSPALAEIADLAVDLFAGDRHLAEKIRAGAFALTEWRPPASPTWEDPSAEPWLDDAGAVAARLATVPSTGLAHAEASARLAEVGPNRLDAKPPIPSWRKLLAEFVDPLVFLLLAAVVISLLVWALEGAEGVPFEAVVIVVILVANAVLGFVQEAKAEHAVAALQGMAAATCSVKREGAEQRIAASEVVPGDVLLLAEGDSVVADARLLSAASLTVAEAALTGESEPVVKDASVLTGDVSLGDRLNMVYSGTVVTRGRAQAVVTATGMRTEMGRIAGLLEETEEDPTPLQREISHLGRTLGIVVLGVAVVVMAAILLTSDIQNASDLVDVLLVGVSLAVAAVPEGLPAILSVVLALGVQRMAAKNAIVTKLSSVETLGSASVICSDKTGTLTRNQMTIVRVVTHSGVVDVTGTGFEPEGDLVAGGQALDDGTLRDETRIVLSGGSLANDASLREEEGQWIVLGDPTEAAFLVAERKAGFDEERTVRFRRVAEVPFTSERKLMSTVETDGYHDARPTVMTKGAPDVLLARCTHEQVGHDSRPLDDGSRQRILAEVDKLADDALRTLGVAYRTLPVGYPDEVGEVNSEVERNLTFAGIVGIIDPPRDEARWRSARPGAAASAWS